MSCCGCKRVDNNPCIDTSITQNNLGVGTDILATPGTSTIFSYKSLTQGTGIILTDNGTDIEIGVTLPNGVDSSFRANVDPTSNVDPTIQGLLIPMGSAEFDMPITISQVLGEGDAYIEDSNSDYTINSDSILFNNDGKFCISVNISVLGSVAKTSPIVCQVLLQGESIFTGPPFSSAGFQDNFDIGPFGPYDKAWILNSTCNVIISAGQILVARILPSNPTDDNAITLTSNISVHRIDDGAFIGPPGAVNEVNNDALASFELVENPGSNSNIIIKGLQAGSNITLTDNSTNIQIDSNNDITLNNLGGGEVVLSDPATNDTFNFKTLVAGSNISLSSDANEITIDNTYVNPNNTLINFQIADVVSGNNIYEISNSDQSATMILSETPDINIFCNGQIEIDAISNLILDSQFQIYVSSVDDFTLYTSTGTMYLRCDQDSVAGHELIIGDLNNSFLRFFNNSAVTLQMNSTSDNFKIQNLPVNTSDNVLYIDSSTRTVSRSPIAITQSNLGAGNVVLANPSTGNSFNFKSLLAGTNITMSNTANDVTINAPTTGFTEGFSVYLDTPLVDPSTDIKLPDSTTFIYTIGGVTVGFNSGILNTSTGTISIATTGRYIINAIITFENNGASTLTPDTINLVFRDSTNAVDLLSTNNAVEINDPLSYNINSVLTLITSTDYEFRFRYVVTTGTQTISNGQFTNFSVQRLN